MISKKMACFSNEGKRPVWGHQLNMAVGSAFLCIYELFSVKTVNFDEKCGKQHTELLSWRYGPVDGFLKALENRKAGFWISKNKRRVVMAQKFEVVTALFVK